MARIRMKDATDIAVLNEVMDDPTYIGKGRFKPGTNVYVGKEVTNLSYGNVTGDYGYILKGHFVRQLNGTFSGKIKKIVVRDDDDDVAFTVDKINLDYTTFRALNNFGMTLNAYANNGLNLVMNNAHGDVNGSEIKDTIIGTNMANVLNGNGGNDTINGRGGVDEINGDNGNDKLFGGDDTDYINGGEGNDLVKGENGDDVLGGGAGRDRLFGGNDNDTLDGGAQADRLDGGRGDDTLTGGTERDIMFGRAGADTFVWTDQGETGTTRKSRDIVQDFRTGQGDKIDVSAIDADTTAASDQDFTFLGRGGFTETEGELRYVFLGRGKKAATIIQGDTDGDGLADFHIQLKGRIALDESDFIL